jgi:hypothetical protein
MTKAFSISTRSTLITVPLFAGTERPNGLLETALEAMFIPYTDDLRI